LILAGRVTAQTFTNLHTFTGVSDGDGPLGGLVLSGNTLYGTAAYGGGASVGTVFRVNTDGTGFTNLHSFTAAPGPLYTNSDGFRPFAGLILSGNTLYGAATRGGAGGAGTLFKLNTDGTGFTILYSFTAASGTYPDVTNSDGAYPAVDLVLSGNTLFGAAAGGGTNSFGTLFKVNTNGAGFSVLHTFTVPDPGTGANSDGAYPECGLILSGNTLYGATTWGGAGSGGTVFKVDTNGSGFVTLHAFTAVTINPDFTQTNSDGSEPSPGLILSGNTLYGTAYYGGSSGNGTVFKLNTDGTGFTNLHSFTALSAANPYTNSDGAFPEAGLILSGNTLYGAADQGGAGGVGTLFKLNTDGTGFTNLYSFTATSGTYPYEINSDGAYPATALVLSGNTLYGTTYTGGSSGRGTVFSLSLGAVSAPQLSVIRSAAAIILTWPTNATGFTLQSTTNLGSPAAWITNSPAPVVVNGQNTVTNATSGTRKFYRLIK